MCGVCVCVVCVVCVCGGRGEEVCVWGVSVNITMKRICLSTESMVWPGVGCMVCTGVESMAYGVYWCGEYGVWCVLVWRVWRMVCAGVESMVYGVCSGVESMVYGVYWCGEYGVWCVLWCGEYGVWCVLWCGEYGVWVGIRM